MKKSKLLQLSLCLSAASMLASVPHADADGDGETGASDEVFGKLTRALETDNRELFLSAFHYPIKICIDGKYIRATNAQALAGYSLDQLLGGQALKKNLRSAMAEMDMGEPYEFTYGGKQVFGFGAYVSDRENLQIAYTDDGVFELTRYGCGMPKQTFCNNPEQDDLIHMQSYRHAWMFNQGVYENFLDHNYSKLVTKPMYDTAGGGLELTLDGKKLNLTRVPSSFDEAPVYSDGAADYLVTLPGEYGVDYCESPIACGVVPYAFVFVKKKGSESCEPGQIVLAEKMELNFCPFDQNANAEIRLFTQGFNQISAEAEKMVGKSYADGSSRAALRFEERAMNFDTGVMAPKGTDPASEGHYKVTAAELTLDGKTLVALSEELHAILFADGDTEIRAVLEGDYDSAKLNPDRLACANDSTCNQPDSRVVLFVRNKTGICERLVLAQVK